MHSVSRRMLVAIVLPLALPAFAISATIPSAKPSAQQLAKWIKQLGDESYVQRENASKNLFAAGHAAEPVLQEALHSTDLEVVRRSREILDKFKWGIYPDTPADIVALIRAYQDTEGNAHADVIEQLLRKEAAGLQALQKIARVETNRQRRKLLRDLVSRNVSSAVSQAVKTRHYEEPEKLLEIGHELQSISHREYVAYWMLRGKLDLPITRYRESLRQQPEDRFSAETLIYLYRARRKWDKAREVARQSKNDVLYENILFECGDWKTLSALPTLHSAESPIEKLAFRAAFSRLSGQNKAFERSIEELQQQKGSGPEHDAVGFAAVKALLLNNRPDEGLNLLAALPEHRVLLFDLLCARLDFRRALNLSEASEGREDGSLGELDLTKARTLAFLGEKDKASRLFKRSFEQIKKEANSRLALTLLQEESKAGMTELALEHCAQLLEFSSKTSSKDEKNHVLEKSYLSQAFPEQAATAEICWPLLRQRYKDEPTLQVLQRLRNVLQGKVDSKEIKRWIDDCESSKKPDNREDLSRQRRCLAEIAIAAGMEKRAIDLLEKVDTPEALVRLGDLQAGKAQWKDAARSYLRAWEKEQSPTKDRSPSVYPDPLPLFLAGAASIEAGQLHEGERLIEQAHWLPMGDTAMRATFLRSLGERGYKEAARREADILWCSSEPNSNHAAAAVRLLALDATKRKDYLTAAQGVEQSMLRCLRQYTQFVANGAYALVPSQVHQLRAQGFLAAGDYESCKSELELALATAPGNLDLPIALVPELERRDHKPEAARMYARSHDRYARLCQEYPRCAWAHNSLAWLAACCCRDLDEGLEHARKAIELSPASAGYHDTLAELFFQRGEKDKAILSQKRAIELDPKRVYYQRQLARLQKGDPAVERPAEDED